MDKFPDILKKAEFTPVYKNDDINDKQNDSPVTTLSNLSKVFEKLTYSQVNTYMSDKFSKYLTGFRFWHFGSVPINGSGSIRDPHPTALRKKNCKLCGLQHTNL